MIPRAKGAGWDGGGRLRGSFDLENPVFRTPVRVITKRGEGGGEHRKEQLFVPGYGFNEILLPHTHTQKSTINITASEAPLIFLYLLGTRKFRNK